MTCMNFWYYPIATNNFCNLIAFNDDDLLYFQILQSTANCGL